jgi:hypothetical protein
MTPPIAPTTAFEEMSTMLEAADRRIDSCSSPGTVKNAELSASRLDLKEKSDGFRTTNFPEKRPRAVEAVSGALPEIRKCVGLKSALTWSTMNAKSVGRKEEIEKEPSSES